MLCSRESLSLSKGRSGGLDYADSELGGWQRALDWLIKEKAAVSLYDCAAFFPHLPPPIRKYSELISSACENSLTNAGVYKLICEQAKSGIFT